MASPQSKHMDAGKMDKEVFDTRPLSEFEQSVKTVHALISKAGAQPNSGDAERYAKAACNTAEALHTLYSINRT